MVCAIARKLGNFKLPDQIALMVKEGNMDKEAVEILCRETNAALEAGNIVFEEVRACVCMDAAHILLLA